MCGHLRSRDRGQSHNSICHSWKPHAARKLRDSKCYRSGVIADRHFTLQEDKFSMFFAPVTLTLTLTRWPSYTNLTHIRWRYNRCANMNSLCQGFWKLSSDTRRQTDNQRWPKLHTIPLGVWSIKWQKNYKNLKKQFKISSSYSEL